MLKIADDNVTKNLPINVRIAEDQDEYLTLPANVEKGIVAYAFKLSFKDILRIIFRRRIYFYQVTFGKAMQPIHANSSVKDFEKHRQYSVDELGVK